MGEARRAGRSPVSDGRAVFWQRHVHIGMAMYTLGAVGVFAYLRATPHGPHRGVLQALDGTSVAATALLFWWAGLQLVRTRWRLAFLCTWSAFTLAAIGAAAGLDGGAASPLATLLLLAVLFAGLAYPPEAVAGLAAGAEAVFVILVVTDGSAARPADGLVGLTVGLAGLLAVTGALNRRAQENRLYELATHDGLTGCLTHRAFQERLADEAARARRYGRPFSVVMADLDRLKEINDAHGHRTGDDALRTVADSLAAGARATDVIGRLGGDEFAVLLPETGEEDAGRIVDRQLAALRAAGGPVEITVSLGTATWSGSGDTAERLLRRADEALYQAKRQGRDRVVASERPGIGELVPEHPE